MNKWIKFGRPKPSKTGKTKIWKVRSSYDDSLGEIAWYGKWRKYAFFPEIYTVYEQDCLQKLSEFCETESKKQRQLWQK